MGRLTRAEVGRMREAGRVASETLAAVAAALRAGMTTADIDALVRRDTAARGGRPSQLGYHGFPAAVCTSRNQVVCHGIPRADEVLVDGDIVNVDVTTELGGYHGDLSSTFCIGTPSAEARHVVDTARRCCLAGIAAVRAGAHLGDIGFAIEALAVREGCSVVTAWGGHGIGKQMHLPPSVDHTGFPHTGLKLKEGMAFTVEPMINLGTARTVTLADGWTVVTADGKWSAQFEHTVVVTKEGCDLMTKWPT